MYEQYYHFAEKPFRLTPDPKYLYESQSHTKAVALLRESFARRAGFAVVTGDVGTGKTMLCRTLFEQAGRKTFTALLRNPLVSEEDLLKDLLRDLGVLSRDDERFRDRSPSRAELFNAVHEFLESVAALGATAALIVDEAQALGVPTLEQIRRLSNITAGKENVLQVVLVGQPDLLSLLRTPELRLLDQRLSIRYRLTALTEDETSAYIAHRLAIAGAAATITFTPSALQLVHRYSAGTPRLINLLCHRALLAGYLAETSRIDVDRVRTAAEGLDLKKGQTEPTGKRRTWLSRLRRASPS